MQASVRVLRLQRTSFERSSISRVAALNSPADDTIDDYSLLEEYKESNKMLETTA